MVRELHACGTVPAFWAVVSMTRRECFTETGKPKVRYQSRADAKQGIAKHPALADAQPYRCSVCGFFHIGHYPTDETARAGLRQRHRKAS